MKMMSSILCGNGKNIERMLMVAVLSMMINLLTQVEKCEAIPKPTDVRVTNTLGDGLDLTIHCKSSEDDLGVHVLKNYQYFQWHFRPNIWGTTRFTCDLQWERGSGTYDMYVNRRDAQLCDTNCVWYIKPDGPCLQSYKPDRQFCSPWQRQTTS